MEGLKRQIRYQLMDTKKAFTIFWGIVLAINILFYYLSINFKNGGFGNTMIESKADAYGNMITTVYTNVASVNIIPIAIFILVCCMIMYYECFPMVIGFSSTRKDFYLGVIAHNILLSFSMAIIQGILLKLDRYFVKAIGKQPFNKVLMFNLEKDNVAYVIAVLFLIFLLACAVFNLLGTVLYKWGYKFWIGFAIISVIVSNIIVEKPILKDPVDFLFGYNEFVSFFMKVIIETVILYGIGWLLIRRRSVRSGK